MLHVYLQSGNNVTIEGYSAVHEGNTDNYVPKWFTGTAITGTESSISAVIANSKVGDMYLNTNTDNVYKSSSINVWSYICNIKGATGAQGPQGPQGPTGPQGPQGPTGLVSKGNNKVTTDANTWRGNFYCDIASVSVANTPGDGVYINLEVIDSVTLQLCYHTIRAMYRVKWFNTWTSWKSLI